MSKQGAELIERLEQWIARYMYLPDPDAALVVAVWAVGTWVFDRFYSWPYLSITASTKGAGKTTLLDLLTHLCRGARQLVAVRPFSLLKSIQERNGHMTLLWDESESASSEAKGFISELLNAGYRKGGVIERAFGKELYTFQVYTPKAFAGIGDLAGTVRDRSIVINLERGQPPTDFIPEIVEQEATALKTAMLGLFGVRLTAEGELEQVREPFNREIMSSNRPDGLPPRDREIWGSMFGLADWLQVSQSQRDRLTRFAFDNAGLKLAPKRRALAEEAEDSAIDSVFSGRAVADLLRVFRVGETKLFTVTAIERLHELVDAPWRTYRGRGLDAMKLSDLLSAHGIQPRQVKIGAKNNRGYYLADVQASGEPIVRGDRTDAKRRGISRRSKGEK